MHFRTIMLTSQVSCTEGNTTLIINSMVKLANFANCCQLNPVSQPETAAWIGGLETKWQQRHPQYIKQVSQGKQLQLMTETL